MTKNINYVSHKKSKVKSNGKPQLPLADALVEGEIAINYAEDVETLSIKNESGTVVTFSSDNYYTEQKLGSGFTGANSAKTVTEVIVENEKVISSSLNDLNARKMDASAYTPTDLSNYYTKSETSGKTEISSALGAKLDSATYTAYTAATETALNGKQNTLTAGTGVNITNDVISVDVEQVFDDTVSASTKPVASKALYSAITDNELVWTNAYTSLSGAVSSHTNNTNVHITSADRTKLNSITGALGTMAYENSSSYSSATQVNSALGGKADTSHNQASSTITAMTSYTSGGTVSPIQTSDTLNQAIGKLESGLGGFRLLQITQQAYDDLQSKDPNTLYIIVD